MRVLGKYPRLELRHRVERSSARVQAAGSAGNRNGTASPCCTAPYTIRILLKEKRKKTGIVVSGSLLPSLRVSVTSRTPVRREGDADLICGELASIARETFSLDH